MIIHHIIIIVTDSMYTSCLVDVSQTTKGASVSLPVQHQRQFSTWNDGATRILAIVLLQSDTWLHQAAYRGRRAQKRHRPDCFHPRKGPFKTSHESQRDTILKQLTILTDIPARVHGELWSSFKMPYHNSYSLCKCSHIGFDLHWKLWKSLHRRRRRRPVMFFVCQNHFQDHWVLNRF